MFIEAGNLKMTWTR